MLPEPENLLCCTSCEVYWSHLACQTDRTTASLKGFLCPICGLENPFKLKDTHSKAVRRSSRAAPNTEAAISSRIFEGKTVLVRDTPDGIFFFPARLIFRHKDGKSWTICWWRHNLPLPTSSQKPGDYAIVSIKDIKDELWRNQSARRAIRASSIISFWCKKIADNILENPEFLPFNSEIEKALRPHILILTELMNSPETVDPDICPAKQWQMTQRQPKKRRGAVPLTTHHVTPVMEHSGGLTTDDCARINNWFDQNVPGATEKQHIWMFTLPISHARTLLVLHRSDFGLDGLKKAFDRLVAWTGKTIDGKDKCYQKADVDLEALSILESLIFDISEDAGVAGNQQWGLMQALTCGDGIHGVNMDLKMILGKGDGEMMM
ncbi:hypothetical protein BDP27DRAFT_1423580 [Rhodocollybia butyracea]|uniref:Uncharacterized protein n=1 Tax=Rhodocollybia butyracea TaxID=206335 RepID=A0A9P5U6B8_9AGAR|nr:hypothetical protein BDP27DRAFT_1423580 [Rhodocollybia butyracea]